MIKYWFSVLETLSYIKNIISSKGVQNWKERCPRVFSEVSPTGG